MVFQNFTMVSKVVFGRGSFNQLADILEPKRRNLIAPFIFIVDEIFKKKSTLILRIPVFYEDQIVFVSADRQPKATQIDALVENIILKYKDLPSGIIGIGGGTVMDIAKAVALMLTNKGETKDYQGLDLVHNPAIYHIGIPTISGSGAEVSHKILLSGPETKLDINSDYATFNQVILDPELTQGITKDQWFYTGMQCFIHCIESLNGTFLNAFSQSYGEKAQQLCEDIFLSDIFSEEEAQDQLMMASWHGGMSIAYSQAGVAYAMSYGLFSVLCTRHAIGNCIVFNHLEEFYPEGVKQFKAILLRHDIELPQGITSNLSESEFDTMIDAALSRVSLWENALGPMWEQTITRQKLYDLYKKM